MEFGIHPHAIWPVRREAEEQHVRQILQRPTQNLVVRIPMMDQRIRFRATPVLLRMWQRVPMELGIHPHAIWPVRREAGEQHVQQILQRPTQLLVVRVPMMDQRIRFRALPVILLRV
jgi:hypothetical protein